MTERSSAPDAGVTPEVVASFRSQLTVGEDVVDPTTWAGSVPVAHGIAPRVRIGRSRWFNLLWLLPIGFVVLIVAVAAAKGLRNMTSVQDFIARNPGTVVSADAAATSGAAALGRGAALLQPVPADLHHPLRDCRSSVIIRGCTGPGTAPRAATGSASRNRFRPIRCGRRRRTPSACPARSGCRASGIRSGWPGGGIWGGHPVAAERRGLLRAAVHHRAVATRWCPPAGR